MVVVVVVVEEEKAEEEEEKAEDSMEREGEDTADERIILVWVV